MLFIRHFPKLEMILSKQQDDTCGLAVEAARHIADEVLCDLHDLRVWDRSLVGKGVDGVAVLDGLGEGDWGETLGGGRGGLRLVFGGV